MPPDAPLIISVHPLVYEWINGQLPPNLRFTLKNAPQPNLVVRDFVIVKEEPNAS